MGLGQNQLIKLSGRKIEILDREGLIRLSNKG
jgi:hypothetical protein